MKDIFDKIEDMYKHPVSPRELDQLEEQVFHEAANSFRETGKIPKAVVVSNKLYLAVQAHTDQVEMYRRRTGAIEPTGPWKTMLVVRTPWGDVEIRRETNG